MIEVQMIEYCVHITLLTLIALGRIMIELVNQFNYESAVSTQDIHNANIIKQNRLYYKFCLMLITIIFICMNAVMLDAFVHFPWGWIFSAIITSLIECTTPYILEQMSLIGISMDPITAINCIRNCEAWQRPALSTIFIPCIGFFKIILNK